MWLILQWGEEYCSPSKPSNTDKRNMKITTFGDWSHSCCMVLWDSQNGKHSWNAHYCLRDKEERSDEIMIRKGKINEFLASLRAGCAGFMNVRTYSWPYTGICEKTCHCCIPVCVSCQKEWPWGNSEHLTRSARRLVKSTTSIWRALCTPQLTKVPARSESTLDVVLENHPGALNKTEASKHLERSDLNAFRSEMSPAEGSSNKAWNIGSFTLNRGPYWWGNIKR